MRTRIFTPDKQYVTTLYPTEGTVEDILQSFVDSTLINVLPGTIVLIDDYYYRYDGTCWTVMSPDEAKRHDLYGKAVRAERASVGLKPVEQISPAEALRMRRRHFAHSRFKYGKE